MTGHRGGKAVFLGDEVAPRTDEFKHMRGLVSSFVWAESGQPTIGDADDVADTVSTETPILPGPGETRVVMLQVPPAASAMREDFDPAAAGEEFFQLQPEMAAVQEPDCPGMHRTESIDYVIVVDGEIWLGLDDQEEVRLEARDVVIQKGTRHAWRNKSESVATLAVVLVGAQRNS